MSAHASEKVRSLLAKFYNENPNIAMLYTWDDIAEMHFYDLCIVLNLYFTADEIKEILHDALDGFDGYTIQCLNDVIENKNANVGGNFSMHISYSSSNVAGSTTNISIEDYTNMATNMLINYFK